MVPDLTQRERLAAAAEGSVRAEGLAPSAHAIELVAEMVRGTRSAAEVRLELLAKHTVKAQRR